MKSVVCVRCCTRARVAPHWGAWIEIPLVMALRPSDRVAPHWGAWIEIDGTSNTVDSPIRRTPLGCVD